MHERKCDEGEREKILREARFKGTLLNIYRLERDEYTYVCTVDSRYIAAEVVVEAGNFSSLQLERKGR